MINIYSKTKKYASFESTLEGRDNVNCSNGNCSSCISDIIEKIIILQKQDFDTCNFIGCDKPFLGPVTPTTCYNTRPVELYNCATGTAWSFNYTNSEGTEAISNILRVEALDDCCCTCRILEANTDGTYTNTNNFATIDLTCCGAIRCLADTSIDLC